ncbi:hypothetical protein [Treponema sp. OMZ 791]|nr:hypothetical protein E4O06_11560 [Treponema sp. OMZ 789]UTC71237.1 hypothetical protein E4O01_11700 [Treponema sp. OMZ 790]UTC73955.1 hypothetical protein E4O02_11795 [Treponema sp. OMZ 791]
MEDAELEGLYYNRYRWYNSETGTYLSQDPNTRIDVFGLAATCQEEIKD